MKRIYVKPLIKVVSCRPMCFFAASDPTQWNINGPTDMGTGEPKPEDDDETEGSSGARGFVWDL